MNRESEVTVHALPVGPRLAIGFEFARLKHNGQVRKGSTIPYISHPMAVSSLALTFGATEDEAIAALLHDTAEDGGGEVVLQEIQETFGADVESIVRGSSDSLVQSSSEKPLWHLRKKQHLEHLAEANRSIHLVAACDKLHNIQSLTRDLQTIGTTVWDRFKTGPKDQLWHYQE